MKKFLTLVLALVMALAIALPAMAFTTDTTSPSDASPFELDIYLVEYSDNDFFGITSLPPADRGYAKNEVVAAVVELYVPKGEDPAADYNSLVFSGKNVSLKVTENDKDSVAANHQLNAVNDAAPTFVLTDDLTRGTAGLVNTTANKTYKWLFFAKVTGDDASLTAKLVDGSGVGSFSSGVLNLTLGGDDYTVTKAGFGGSAGTYTVVSSDAGMAFVVNTDKNNKTTGMAVATSSSATPIPLGVTVGGVLGIVQGNTVVTSGDTFEAIMDEYNDYVKGVFGLDYMLIGNYLRDSFWTGLTSADTLSATVEIKPWTAYVTVPDNIIVDPPKTGDAASIVGFVMIVLAAAAVVAVKKVRA